MLHEALVYIAQVQQLNLYFHFQFCLLDVILFYYFFNSQTVSSLMANVFSTNRRLKKSSQDLQTPLKITGIFETVRTENYTRHYKKNIKIESENIFNFEI